MQLKSSIVTFCLALTVIMTFGTNVQAQSKTDFTPTELSELFACRSETNPETRLACYDKAVGDFETAQSKGDVVTITKQQIEDVEKDSFGFSLPSIPKLGSLFGTSNPKPKNENDLIAPVETTKTAERPEIPTKLEPKRVERNEIKEIEVAISRTQEFGYKKTRFFLENGQVWEQVDTRSIRVPKARNGSVPTAVIQKASLGSFLLRINGKGTAIRVRRVR